MQTALIDKATKKAVKKFQRKVGPSATGKVDQATMAAIQKKVDSRKPYVTAGKYDEHHPGTHELSDAEQKQALDAMVPITGATSGSSAAFVDVVNGEMYGDRMKAQLRTSERTPTRTCTTGAPSRPPAKGCEEGHRRGLW